MVYTVFWSTGSCRSAPSSVLPLRFFRMSLLPDSEYPFHILLRNRESGIRFMECAFEGPCCCTGDEQEHSIHTSDSSVLLSVIGSDGTHLCLFRQKTEQSRVHLKDLDGQAPRSLLSLRCGCESPVLRTTEQGSDRAPEQNSG